jgi:hypothetical protein
VGTGNNKPGKDQIPENSGTTDMLTEKLHNTRADNQKSLVDKLVF